MVTIFPLTRQRYDEARSLLAAFLAEIGEPALNDESWSNIRQAHELGKIQFYVAEAGAKLVALCSLTVGFSTYCAGPFGILDDFYVMPSMRKKGVAGLLMKQLLIQAEELGCRSVLLGCQASDVAMYEHFGFRKIGIMMAIDL